MIINILAEMNAEKDDLNAWAKEMVDRVDAHIRDLETLKFWILDTAKVRSDKIDKLIGGGADAGQL